MDYVVGTWHHVSLLALAAVVAALVVVVGVLAALAADLALRAHPQALEEELQRTYVRLRAAEARAGRRPPRPATLDAARAGRRRAAADERPIDAPARSWDVPFSPRRL